MSDDADAAQIRIDADLDRRINAARGLIPSEPRGECVDCGADLAEHRRAWGICIECKTKRETRDRTRGYGV